MKIDKSGRNYTRFWEELHEVFSRKWEELHEVSTPFRTENPHITAEDSITPKISAP